MNAPLTQAEKALGMRQGARGRKDSTGQEVEPDAKVVEENLDTMIALREDIAKAQEKYSKKVKAVAKDAGMNAKAVRTFVDARSGEGFEKAKQFVTQVNMLFEEIGGEDD